MSRSDDGILANPSEKASSSPPSRSTSGVAWGAASRAGAPGANDVPAARLVPPLPMTLCGAPYYDQEKRIGEIGRGIENGMRNEREKVRFRHFLSSA